MLFETSKTTLNMITLLVIQTRYKKDNNEFRCFFLQLMEEKNGSQFACLLTIVSIKVKVVVVDLKQKTRALYFNKSLARPPIIFF